jgi:hypothetical protein
MHRRDDFVLGQRHSTSSIRVVDLGFFVLVIRFINGVKHEGQHLFLLDFRLKT